MDYLYQELDAARTAELEAHVHDCARCELEIGRFSRTRQALRELPELEPSVAVSTRLLHEASKRARPERRGFFGWLAQLIQPIVMHPAWTAGVTAVVLLAVTTVLSIHGKEVNRRVQAIELAEPERTSASASAPAAEAKAEEKPVAPAKAEADDVKAHAAAADRPLAVRTPDTEIPSEGGKVAAPASVSGPPPARERAATDKAGATGRIASPSEQKPLDSMKKKAGPARDEPASTEDNKSAEVAAAQPAASAPPPPPPGAAVSSSTQNGFAVPAEPASPPAQKEVRRADTAQSDNERSQAGGAGADAASPPTVTTAPNAPAKPSAAPASKAASTRPKQDAAPASPPASSPAVGAPADRRGKAEGYKLAPEPMVAEKADDQTAATKDEAKVAPEEELFRQAQKEATVGRCASALSIAQKIQRTNDAFYRRRIVGDPTLESCSQQQQQRKAKSVAPSKAAPANQELNAPADADRKSAK